MARTTHVKSAQARFKTVPTIDPATGEQKVTPVLRKDGTQKVTKHGKPVVIRLTHADKTQPLPNRTCDKCQAEILPGTSYKWIKPKSGPYGGRLMVRCSTCPGWNVWDYSSSLSARLAQISHDAHEAFGTPESPEDVTTVLADAAEAVRELAQEKRDSAENIRDGFQHDTYQSEELDQQADDLDSWADEIEGADVPELPEPEDEDCDQCSGTGKVENPDYDSEDDDSDEDEEVDCDDCDGSGTISAGDDPSDDQMDEWRNEAEAALEIVDESPV